jgi:hypothetical protein
MVVVRGRGKDAGWGGLVAARRMGDAMGAIFGRDVFFRKIT